jgi:hypothetical protein
VRPNQTSTVVLLQVGESVRRLLLIAICLFGLLSAPATMDTAMACPMCQAAKDSAGEQVASAYRYSILFMLAMPATVLTGFSIGFYRLSKKPRDSDFDPRS